MEKQRSSLFVAKPPLPEGPAVVAHLCWEGGPLDLRALGPQLSEVPSVSLSALQGRVSRGCRQLEAFLDPYPLETHLDPSSGICLRVPRLAQEKATGVVAMG